MDRFRVRFLALAAGTSIFLSPINGLGADTPRAESETFSEIEREFPESRFGYSPARGGRVGTSENDRMETPNRLRNAGRAPASAPVGSLKPSAIAEDEDNSGTHRSGRTKPVQFATDIEAVSARRKGVQEVAVIAGDLGFFPKTVFVTRDIPVRLFVTGASKSSLCLMMDSFQVRKQVRANKIEEINFTPSQPGQYRFYCPVNGMEGTLIVKELAASSS